MKVKRQKHVQRILTFYKSSFGIKAPYSVLIDGTFCKSALLFRINISEQLPKYLTSETKLYTTRCILAECEALGPLLYGPLTVLRQFNVHQCSHKSTLPATKCIMHACRTSSDKSRFFIATQDPELTEKIRAIPGVPLLFMSHNAINLENPSEASRKVAAGVLDRKLAPSDEQHKTLVALKRDAFGEKPEKKRKRKGPKGPNPLSCLKKKRKVVPVAEQSKTTKRKARKRKRNRHVVITESVQST
ncbi:rRNA-processing protein UTP23-like protein [Lamellibrachia satsuma]|nr:rRNA-processing protein UTP23-like protein [Lamellibrachia satsuma]